MMLDVRDSRWVVAALVTFAAAALVMGGGCATGETIASDGGGGSTSSGDAGTEVTGGGGEGGTTGLCGMDCTVIATPPCLKSVCNEGTYPGPVGQCTVVPDEGAPCEDTLFCTTNDTCDATGQCVGGPVNDCGLTPEQCNQVTCNEASDNCSQTASMNGTACTDPSNLCLNGTTCQNGLCTGGTLDDCFFFPVSDNCHVAVCNPANGMCEEQIGNEGLACIDQADLCTLNKTCASGVCSGGTPKDCSMLTVGCFDGQCNTNTGLCVQIPIMPGQQCAEATDQCNIGICDMGGNCNATPANQGLTCNDANHCTSGETCNNGSCTGGAQTTACITGDLCCPPSCTISNDADCATSCLALLQNNPSALDGVYQIYEGMVQVDVYCDMTHGGVTYRELGFGDYTGSFPGFDMVSVADLNDPVIQQAFVFLYNQQGHGLNNITIGWNSSNCCIKALEHISSNSYLTLGGEYLYPASMSNQQNCNSFYGDPQYRFQLALSSFQFAPAPMPTNYFSTNPAGTTTLCSDSNNPAFWWRRF